MKLYHPNENCQLGLTSGHTFVVSKDPAGVEVPQRFHKIALARGCLPVGMVPEQDEAAAPDRASIIKTQMRAMMNSDDEKYFDTAGRPSRDILGKLCGFGVESKERDRLWREVQSQLEAEGGQKASA